MSVKHLATALEAGRNIYTELSRPRRSSRPSLQPVDQLTLTRDIPCYSTGSGVFALEFMPDSDYVAAGYGNGAIGIYGVSTGKQKAIMQTSVDGLPVTCIRSCPADDQLIAASSSDGSVTIWNTVGAKKVESVIQPGNEINAVDYCSDGTCYATAGKNARIVVYDSLTNGIQLEIEAADEDSVDVMKSGHSQRIFALRFHPQHKSIFVTGGWDRCIKVWDVRDGNVIASLPGPYICGDAIDIQGNDILTGSWKAKDALQIWDMGTTKVVESLLLPDVTATQFFYCARFCDGSRAVAAGGSGTNALHVLRRLSHEEIGTIEGGRKVVQAMATNAGGLRLASGGLGRNISLATLS
ncbi:uncharacterized protein [Oscarella lobularis]|uniref:uncharacterized protein n=1 Tax=Oscarella lobularis TaxID=121494 RepID=UPI0033144459